MLGSSSTINTFIPVPPLGAEMVCPLFYSFFGEMSMRAYLKSACLACQGTLNNLWEIDNPFRLGHNKGQSINETKRKGFLKMVTHIVMWNLKEEAEGAGKEQNAAIMKERLEALVGKIPGLISLTVGRNVMPTGYDLCLLGQYEDIEALKLYRDHPLHKEVQQFVHKVITDRVSCDFAD